MFELWYAIVAVMFAAYVVLDGYDLGAGALHLIVAKSAAERRQVLAAVGPFWDANEVWLLAAGGALFGAFPRVLAGGVSGVFLAILLGGLVVALRPGPLVFRGPLAGRPVRPILDSAFAGGGALLALR